MPEIIRWEEQVKNGVYERYLYGLPIFDTNGVHGVEDAMVTFLRALVSAYPCAAQIGLMALEGDDPRALFAPLKEGVDFFLTQVDSYAHGGIWVSSDPEGGCFFPRLPASFFDLPYDDTRLLIDYLIGYDQPILYLNVDGAYLRQLENVYRHPPACNGSAYDDCWWGEVTKCIPLGLRGGGDDAMYTVYTRDQSYFHLLDAPLTETCEAIRATPWFHEHMHELRWWDEGDGLSLMLPEVIEVEKAAEAQRQENQRKMAQPNEED